MPDFLSRIEMTLAARARYIFCQNADSNAEANLISALIALAGGNVVVATAEDEILIFNTSSHELGLVLLTGCVQIPEPA